MVKNRQLYPTDRLKEHVASYASTHGLLTRSKPHGRDIDDLLSRVYCSRLCVSTGNRAMSCNILAPLSASSSVAHHSMPTCKGNRHPPPPCSLREHLHTDGKACSARGRCRRRGGQRRPSGLCPRRRRLVKRSVTSQVLGVHGFLSNRWAQAKVLKDA